MRVIVVSVGNYSDYVPRGVFSTPAKANAFKMKFPEEDWNENLEIEVDYESITPLIGRRIFQVTMLKDGYVVENKMLSTNFANALNANAHKGHFQPWCWEGERCIGKSEGVLVITVWGANAQHATEIVNEMRTRLIVTNTWNTHSDLNACWGGALK